MKKLSLFLLCVCAGGLLAQTSVYKPFPTLYGMWDVKQEGPYDPSGGPGGGGASISWYRFQAFGDTIIGSYTYKKVIGAPSSGNPVDGIVYGPYSFCFGYRNDSINKRVYIYTNRANYFPDFPNNNILLPGGQYRDTLWYDFNLNVGDTLKSNYSLSVNPSNNYNKRTIVYSIDSVLIYGVYHKQFHFCNGASGGTFNTDLIEGAGFGDNFIQTGYVNCPFEPTYVYHTNFFYSLESVPDAPSLNKQIKLFPNPASSTLQINYSGQNKTAAFNYFITDCLGKIVSGGTTTGSIDVSNMENGLYFLILYDSHKNSFREKFIKQ